MLNALLGIADAQRALTDRGDEIAVGKYLSILADADLQELVGIRLLALTH
jgi:hypothetical protein